MLVSLLNSRPRLSRVQFRAQGFGWKQIRHMVGAALAVGQRKLLLEDIEELLRNGLPAAMLAGSHRGWNVADPRGLCKMHVEYDL